jgi:nucleotide-binding universal stress UspA family protein
MVFTRVLVALDHSFQTSLVFDQALEQIKSEKAHLLIVHVIRQEDEIQPSPLVGIGTIADVDMYNALHQLQHERIQKEMQTAQTWLQPYCQQATSRQISSEIGCTAGIPGVVICDIARSWNADLIVLGRRGHQGLKEIVLGSVSNYVVHHAPCSVLIVQGVGSY